MILELVGSRLVAPFLGSSLYIWTALIGIILACLSLGNWLGGEIADRMVKKKPVTWLKKLSRWLTSQSQPATLLPTQATVFGMAAILATASLGIVWISWTHLFWLSWIRLSVTDLRLAAVLSTIILFAPSTIILGMVTPFCTRLALSSMTKAGATIGLLYALGTAGSITGTFLAGFWLFSWFGSTNIILGLAAILWLKAVGLSVFGWRLSQQSPGAQPQTQPLTVWWVSWIVVVPLVLSAGGMSWQVLGPEQKTTQSLFPNTTVLLDTDTAYQRLLVFDSFDEKTERPVRNLVFGYNSYQTSIWLDSTEIKSEYIQRFRLIEWLRPDTQQALMIGGGGFSYPPAFLDFFPASSRLTIAEIDPKVTEIARQYFGLPQDPRLEILHQDGRLVLNEAQTNQYQAIIMDAFGDSLSTPFHLTTLETVQEIDRALDAQGVVLVNILSAATGPNSQFLQDQLAVYQAVFPEVKILQMSQDTSLNQPQNLLLVAAKQPLAETAPEPYASWLAQAVPVEELGSGQVLTDNYAPVEASSWQLQRTIFRAEQRHARY